MITSHFLLVKYIRKDLIKVSSALNIIAKILAEVEI